ncbi:protein KTI12 homolog [Lucilia sericata]|uniref:protein KTI12 homolog n=1 Tax=Lucilia sericata TaxID=13632 RepID=UPI0018A85DAB|nr:protein KTI12 homolog [Lucilia sericata]XP_037808358.1 protein KTI12 homolog [Lucilia sericata]
MPLIVISGYPASGKTKRALELQKFFEEKGKRVHHISENKAIPKAGFHKNVYFADSQKEKVVRSDLKSEALRLLDKESVVILDAGNYIKGYRYELFCATKAARSTQCTLFCGIQKQRAWEFNQQRSGEEVLDLAKVDDVSKLDNSNIPYSQEIFEGLCMRFEEPHGNCRWDSPLFVSFPDDNLEFEAIFSALFESKPLPPNQSTQNPPLSSTNYLFELDRLTQEIVGNVLAARKIGVMGPVPVKNSEIKVQVPANMNAIQLNRLRRQFLNYSKHHHATSSSLDKVPQLFVQFLNSNCGEN